MVFWRERAIEEMSLFKINVADVISRCIKRQNIRKSSRLHNIMTKFHIPKADCQIRKYRFF